MGQTVVEKLAQRHMVAGPRDRAVRAGDFVNIRPTHVLTHDNTAPVIEKFRGLGADRVRDPKQPVFVLDHDVQNRTEKNLAKYQAIEGFARDQGIDFHPAGTGIGHQVICERLYARPGAFVVASDSHANTYGALAALGTPVVRTDAAAIWATGEFWWQVPRTVQVVLRGELRDGVSGKDAILALCGHYHGGEVLNAAVEFVGPGVANLSVEARLTIANMTTEWGALVGWFPVDDRTRAFVRSHGGQVDESDLPVPDDDATHAARITLDLESVVPTVAGPDAVGVTQPLAAMEAEGIPIQKAYLVSCVNSRLEDLSEAARVVEGGHVADGVEFYFAAASREIQDSAEQKGIWQILLAAGGKPLPPSCGPCIGLGQGLLEPGEVGISATNRNFKGRMGSRDARCYLASPAVVAASALAGHICGPNDGQRGEAALRTAIETFEAVAPPSERVAILPGFPENVRGRLVFVPKDDLNTDGIYGKDYTYRDDMTPEAMARVVMENYDPGFAERAAEGDLLIGGWNFGTGSSREQAVTALQAKGFRLVIAASFSQTYLRNAFNNGFVCIECPEFSQRLRETLGTDEETVIPGDDVEVDFAAGSVTWRGESFIFPPLGEVPQSLVIAGGIENQVRNRLADTAV